MRPSASLAVRALSIAAAGFIALATVMPQDADARAGRGGSFGSRGAKTYDAPPSTATMPGAAPMQRSVTQPGSPSAGAPSPSASGQAGRSTGGLFGGRFGGIGAGIMGGLVGAGLFGLLSGSGLFGGLGGMASILGLVIQLAIIFFVVRFALNWWRNRQSPQTATAGAGASGYSYDPNRGQTAPVPPGELERTSHDGDRPSGSSGSSHYDYASRSGAGSSGYGSSSQYGRDEQGDVEIVKEDFDAFERMLTDVQDAWTHQDLLRLRGLATPEMVEIFGEDLAEDASRGVVNKVSGIKLLQGDLAEAWSEGAREYATVAMRYELVDVTVDRDSGRVVDGDETPTEASEMWTFLRAGQSGRWLLSAIQQAA